MDLEKMKRDAAEAKAIADKATPGPWVYRHGTLKSYVASTDEREDLGVSLQALHWKDGYEVPAEANTEHIAHARTAAPTLTDHVLALAADVERLRESVARVDDMLSKNGCDCDCDHDAESHDDDCERCLACRVDAALHGGG